MAITTKAPGAPGVSLSYITIGAVLTVLSGTSYIFFNQSSGHPIVGYIRMSALILGIVFLAIGFGVGRIGQVSGETEKTITSDGPVAVVPPPTTVPAASNPIYTTNTTRNV